MSSSVVWSEMIDTDEVQSTASRPIKDDYLVQDTIMAFFGLLIYGFFLLSLVVLIQAIRFYAEWILTSAT